MSVYEFLTNCFVLIIVV